MLAARSSVSIADFIDLLCAEITLTGTDESYHSEELARSQLVLVLSLSLQRIPHKHCR